MQLTSASVIMNAFYEVPPKFYTSLSAKLYMMFTFKIDPSKVQKSEGKIGMEYGGADTSASSRAGSPGSRGGTWVLIFHCTYHRSRVRTYVLLWMHINLYKIQHEIDLRTQFHVTLVRQQTRFTAHKSCTTFVKLISVLSEATDSTVVFNMTSPILPFQSLDENPRQHFAEFE